MLTGTLVGIAACNAPPPEPNPRDIQNARRAAMQLDAEIHREILSQLEQAPVETLYLRYRRRAPEIAAQVSEEYDLTVRRTGLRVRNRANAADDWEFEKLEALEFSMSAGLDPALLELAEVVEGEGGQQTFRWIRPLIMTEECLVCHGENIPVEILDLLMEEYPSDDATGYFEYELGGAYSVSRVIE